MNFPTSSAQMVRRIVRSEPCLRPHFRRQLSYICVAALRRSIHEPVKEPATESEKLRIS